jgi:ribosomal protein S18 acetylase RimI-like enzyme
MATAGCTGSPEVQIRPFDRRRDAVALEASVAALQRYEHDLEPDLPDGRGTAARYVDGMLRRCAAHRGRVFVADAVTALAGFVCVLGRVVERGYGGVSLAHAVIGELYVAEAWRGRGVASELLSRAERHAQACGAERLRVQVLAGNAGARGLYESFGFGERLLELDKRIAGASSAGGPRRPSDH